MLNSYRRKTCRLCDSAKLELAIPLQSTPRADAYLPANRLHESDAIYPLGLWLCLECGHAQLCDIIPAEALFRDYLYRTSHNAGLVQHFRRYADDVLKKFSCAPDSLVVDIGSNDGTLLKLFKAQGMRVQGIDPAEVVSAEANQAGIPTECAFFTSDVATKLRAKLGGARLVFSNNAFAHSDALPDMADGVRIMLADDGVFIFEVSYLGDLVEKLLFDTIFHEHLSYHSIKPLMRFLNRHGLELVGIEMNESKGGTMRCFAQKLNGPLRQWPTLAGMIKREEELGLANLSVYQAYSKNLDRIKGNLLTLLKKLRSEGKTIAGYGAAASCTTLIYNFEIGPFLKFIADDNPVRHGLFSPGLHIPIVDSKTLLTDNKADYVVIVAWMYAAPIIARNKAFTAAGGKFIVPLPEVTIVG